MGNSCYELYHGSRAIEDILRRGFDIEAPRTHDPGDFGWGIYFTGNLTRAKTSGGYGEEGPNVVKAQVCFENPLVLHSPYSISEPETEGDRLIHDLRERYGDTVHGITQEEAVDLHREGVSPDEINLIQRERREAAARKWAQEIQKEGYDAVVWEQPYYRGPIEPNFEVVVFDPAKVKGVQRYSAPWVSHGEIERIAQASADEVSKRLEK